MARQCAFCATTANMSGEHLWSEWIGEALKASEITNRRKTQTGETIAWPTRGLNAIAKVVCETCNNGWMSNLENASKTILKDMIVECRPAILSTKDIIAIAAVSFKNMVVADHMKDNGRPPFFSDQERRQFRKNLTLPRGLQMWFGSAEDSPHGLFKSYTCEVPRNSANRFEINIFTYGVGHLLVQATCFKWKRKSTQKHVPPRYLTQGSNWDEVFIPFWPSNGGTIRWPGNSHLARHVVDSFVHRWESAKILD